MRETAFSNGVTRRARSTESHIRADRTPIVDRTGISSNRRRRLPVKRSLFVFIITVALVAGGVTVVTMNRDALEWPAHTAAQTVIKGFTLQYQYSDSGMPCAMCQRFMLWHFGPPPRLWDDVKYGGLIPGMPPGDNLYGFVGLADDCPHCIVYSGPASIWMISQYRTGAAPAMDVIYDTCELDGAAGEIAKDGLIQRHGVGMTDGFTVTPPEIQIAFNTFVGQPFQHNQWDASALIFTTLESYILSGYPVLWDDRNMGWPINMDRRWPAVDVNDQGHYKVIAGYDDGGTARNPADDFALIYDPWPEYNDPLVQPAFPVGALPGPTGLFDPYWLPIPLVLGDQMDLFLVEFAAIPEFSGLLIPIVGLTIIAIVAIRFGTGRREP